MMKPGSEHGRIHSPTYMEAQVKAQDDAHVGALPPTDDGPGKGLVEGLVERTGEKAVEKTVEIIINAMKVNSKITQKELITLTGLTRRGIEWNIAKLKKEGRIKRVGPDKGGHWEIIDDEK